MCADTMEFEEEKEGSVGADPILSDPTSICRCVWASETGICPKGELNLGTYCSGLMFLS